MTFPDQANERPSLIQLIAVVCNAFLVLSYVYGIGRHIVYVPKADVPKAAMWLWAGEPTDLFAVYLVRLSICLFFLRLVPPKKIYLWTIWVTIALLTASNIFTSIYFFFECRPIRKVWNPMAPGVCFSDEVKKGAIWLYQGTRADSSSFGPELLRSLADIE